jgi:hypothetical protein
VFLWAIVVATAVDPADLARTLGRGDRTTLTSLFIAKSAPAVLSLLWAFLSDAVPIMGTRREGYLLLAAILTLAASVGAIFAPHAFASSMAVVLAVGVGAAVATAATWGALAELGQRLGASGRLAAAAVGLPTLVSSAMFPVEERLMFVSANWSLGLTAVLAASLLLLLVVLSDEGGAAPTRAASPPVERPTSLLARSFWIVFVIGACGALAMTPARLGRNLAKVPSEVSLLLSFEHSAATFASALVYALVCWRVSLRKLLRLSLLAQSAAAIAALMPWWTEEPSRTIVDSAFWLTSGLSSIALLDLAIRTVPVRRAALGLTLFASARPVIAALSSMVLVRASMPPLAAVGAVASLVGALLVSRVPPSIRDPREGLAPTS